MCANFTGPSTWKVTVWAPKNTFSTKSCPACQLHANTSTSKRLLCAFTASKCDSAIIMCCWCTVFIFQVDWIQTKNGKAEKNKSTCHIQQFTFFSSGDGFLPVTGLLKVSNASHLCLLGWGTFATPSMLCSLWSSGESSLPAPRWPETSGTLWWASASSSSPTSELPPPWDNEPVNGS